MRYSAGVREVGVSKPPGKQRKKKNLKKGQETKGKKVRPRITKERTKGINWQARGWVRTVR